MRPTQTRFTIHLVDPVRARRDGLERGLQLRFGVRSFGLAAESLAAAQEDPPHAVVYTLRQGEGNGLTAAEAFRKAVGPDPLLLVHGVADDSVTPDRRRALMLRHQVDLWVPRALDAETLEVLLWNELLQRVLPRERRVAEVRPEVRAPVPAPSFFARLAGARPAR